MEVLEFETELVRNAYERHQSSIDETARFLKRFAETNESSSDTPPRSKVSPIFGLHQNPSDTVQLVFFSDRTG